MDKWTSKTPFPTDNFKLRCIEEKFGPSNSSGKPMITLEFEIVAPETIEIAGVQMSVSGAETNPHYMTTRSIDENGVEDLAKSESLQKRLNETYVKFGLQPVTDFDNPPLGFKGKVVWALLQAETREKRKAPTADQLAKGIKQGDVITNPITGQPLINYYPRVNEIFGLAPE